ERLGGGHDRDVVLGGLGGRVVLDDGAAAGLEVGLEGIGDALPEGLGVVDDVDAGLLEDVIDVLGGRRALDVVRRDHADVVVRLGPQLSRGRALGQVRVGVGG